MPSGGASARRYGQAVFELAQEAGSVDTWHKDLQLMAEVFQDRQVEAYFLDPKRNISGKQAAAGKMFDGRVQPQALNLLRLLVERGRIEILPLVLDRFETLVRQSLGIVTAEVTTAIEIDHDEEQRIGERLSRMTGKRVRIEKKVDPAIIGGLVARIEDQLIDGSVVTSLQQLRQRLN